MLRGQCHCGQISYEMPDQVDHHTLCHCTDCRRCAGAPAVSWGMIDAADLRIDGEPKRYRSSEHAERLFCGTCGTGLFYVNESIFPGKIDVQTATLDDPAALPIQAQIQTAERIGWMEGIDRLHAFERYPG